MAVEALVLLFGDFGGLAQPDRLLRIQHLVFDRFGFVLVDLFGRQDDRVGDEVRIAPHDFADLPAVEILRCVVLQMQRDRRALLGPRIGVDFVTAFAAAGPLDRREFAAGLFGHQLDLRRDHESGVEADAELADQLRQRFLVVLLLLKHLQERLGSALRDGADVLDDLLFGHADAVVADGQRFGVFVDAQADLPFAGEFRRGQALEARLVDRVRRVCNEFAQKNIPVRVQRMNHQIQQLLHFRLEFSGCCHLYCSSDGRGPQAPCD